VASAAPRYVGIDLGGTKTLALVAEADGSILSRATVPTPASGSAERVVGAMANAASQALAAASLTPGGAAGIGIASAGAVDAARGTVVHSPQIGSLSDTPVVTMLRAHIDLPAVIDNDANLAALGEQRYGAGRGERNVVFITISTGIGGGIIIDGGLYRGANGAGGEIGHMSVDAHGPYGRSTTRGAWESLCSGTALARIAGERMAAGEASSLRAVASRAGSVSAEDIFAAARDGDELAGSVIADAVEYLGAGLTSLVNIFDPGKIIVGGGLSNEWEAYISPAVERMRQESFAGIGARTPVVPPDLGVDAGALGAVAYAHDMLGAG
jgi:glucokinase